MKKRIALLLSVILILSTILGIQPMNAVQAAGDGLYSATSTAETGMSFHSNATYATDGALERGDAIATFSSWINLSTSVTGRGGTIFGNNGNGTYGINFEIHENGKPRIWYSHFNAQQTFDTDVRGDKWVHLVVTITPNYNENVTTMSCYLNGVLVETITLKKAIKQEAYQSSFLLGGDGRTNNERYFQGRIKEVALYNTVLSADDIQTLYIDGVNAVSTQPFSYYDLTSQELYTDIPDVKNNNNLTVDYFYTDKEPVTDYAYSFAVVGDTQNVTEYDSENGESYLNGIYDWLVQNKDEKKIKYVFGVGDVTHRDKLDQWKHAQEQIQKLDGVIPYSVVRGNHDVPKYGNSSSTLADGFSEYLGTEAYKEQFQSGDFYSQENIWNAWRTFKVGEINYLMLSLDYGAQDDVLIWADKVISDYPNHNVIISTHAYIANTGALYTGAMDSEGLNNGQAMYDKLISKHDNIVLVLCGHDPSNNVVYRTDNNTTALLIDQQDVDRYELDAGNSPAAIVTMLYFSEDGTQIQVECISTSHSTEGQDVYFKKANELTLPIDITNEVDRCDYLVQEYSATQAKKYLRGKNSYPAAEKEGYIFAGWYTDEACDDTCMLKGAKPTGTVYALFVPKHVLSVKAQISSNWLDDDSTNNTTGSIRFITTVDSLRYKSVGFELSYVDADGETHCAVSNLNKVYDKLYEMVGTSVWARTPEGTFCAKSKYFKACVIEDLPLSTYQNIEFTIKPYWITMDGNKVYGETAIRSIQQGMNHAEGFINN